MAEVQLGGKLAAGRVALVDDADMAMVSQYSWSIHRSKPGREYVRGFVRGSGGQRIYLHQLIAGKGADHRNGDGLDNRRGNLRPAATRSQNGANQGARKGRYKGVFWSGSAYIAQVQVNRHRQHLGSFRVEEDAARAYDAAALAAWGEFARLNFP